MGRSNHEPQHQNASAEFATFEAVHECGHPEQRQASFAVARQRDMVLYFDSFSSHNTNKVLGSLQNASGSAISKNIMSVYLSYDEESLRNRRQYVKHNSTIFQQVEVLSIVTHEPFQDAMTYRARLLFKGSSLGNKIGDIALDAPAALWNLQLKDRGPKWGDASPSTGAKAFSCHQSFM